MNWVVEGVYTVADVDLRDFLYRIPTDKTVILSMYRWSYSKTGTSRDGVVNAWLVVVR